MFVAAIRMVGFRSYEDTSIELSPGLNIVVGANASGKTNLVEAAYWALRGSSPRTRRDDKLVRWGAPHVRVELRLGDGTDVASAYSTRTGRRVTVAGVEAGAADRLNALGPAFLFVPESLLLVKGGPARRRAHVDGLGASLEAAYGAAVGVFREAVRQRNALLCRARAGGSAAALDAWDAQYVDAGLELAQRRRELVDRLAPPFGRFAAQLAPGRPTFGVSLRDTLEDVGDDRGLFLEELRRRRPRELESGVSAFGPHRDDLEIFEEQEEGGRRDLRMFGSQGEQRSAVLALLLAEREVAAERLGEPAPLFLDDVMSELDEVRRRLLVATLADSGQTVITTTTEFYFEPDELGAARVIRLSAPAGAGGATTAVAGASSATAQDPDA